jgi:hypothetical protein
MGGWHSVSRQQFETYYTNQESGIGVWVSAAELLPSPIARGPTSPELGPSLAATTANSTINRRSDGSTEHRPPTKPSATLSQIKGENQ